MNNPINSEFEYILNTIRGTDANSKSEAIARFKDIPFELLLICLNDENDTIRNLAARTLGIRRNTKAVEFLIKCLNDKKVFVRQSVVDALGYIGDERAAKPLMELLQSYNAEWSQEDNSCLRMNIIYSLYNFDDPNILPLLELIEKSDIGVDYRGLTVKEVASQVIEAIEQKQKTNFL
jgi:HEAT repeat protein